jgi:hypothetical protein
MFLLSQFLGLVPNLFLCIVRLAIDNLPLASMHYTAFTKYNIPVYSFIFIQYGGCPIIGCFMGKVYEVQGEGRNLKSPGYFNYCMNMQTVAVNEETHEL